MDDRIREALAAAREAAALDRDALAAGRRAEIVCWRRPVAHSSPHRPEPWFSQRGGREPQWREGEPDPHADVVVGFDAEDRVVLCEVRWPAAEGSRLEEVWRHGDGWSDCLLADGARRIVYEHGRPVLVASSSGEVESWTYAGATAVRGELAEAGYDFLSAECYEAEVDADGTLRALSHGSQFLDPVDDEEAALALALARAREIVPDRVVYDRRLHASQPPLGPADDVVALLVPAIEAAVVTAVEASSVPDPFVVELALPEDGWPPVARVGGDAFRRRMTERSPSDGAALAALHRASPPFGESVELAPLLSDAVRDACRALNGAGSTDRAPDDPERRRAAEVRSRVAAALSERLNARDWPRAVQPFLAIARFSEPFPDPLALAGATTGADRVMAFVASIRSRRGDLPAPAQAARTDRAALAAVLADRGLEDHAGRLAHEVAQVGHRLLAGDGAGRLGGPPLLPRGEQWPEGLTFLAGIDTRAIEGLPDGWMLFFGDPERWVEDGEGARFYFTEDPVAARGPALRPRPVRAQATLTLPDGFDLEATLGLDPAEGEALETVAAWLRHGDAGFSLETPDHWVLGAVTDAQGYGLPDDEVLLLHLGWDSALGFEHLDGGALRFRIPRDALAAGDWKRVTADSSSS